MLDWECRFQRQSEHPLRGRAAISTRGCYVIERWRATHIMALEYDLSTDEVFGPIALRLVSQVDRLSSAAALLKRL